PVVLHVARSRSGNRDGAAKAGALLRMRSGRNRDHQKCERIVGDCAAWFDPESGRRSADHKPGLSAHDHDLAAARAKRWHCPETDYFSCTAAEPGVSGETHREKYYAA